MLKINFGRHGLKAQKTTAQGNALGPYTYRDDAL